MTSEFLLTRMARYNLKFFISPEDGDTMEMLSRAIEKTNLNEHVLHLVRTAILSRELPPGTRLRAGEVAVRLGISATPVKDAFNRLAAEGLIVIEPRRGTFVSSFDARDLRELLDVRRILELRAAELAIDRIGSQDILRMKTLAAKMEKLSASRLEESEVRAGRISEDISFHRILVNSCGNRHLIEMHQRVHSFGSIAGTPTSLDRRGRTDIDHRAMLAALESRSTQELLSVIDAHLRSLIDAIHVE